MSELVLAFDSIPVKSKAVWQTWCVQLSVSETAKESMGYEELRELEGTFAMRLPCEPLVGDGIPYKGHFWRVDCRLLEPVRYRSKSQKKMPTIVCSYVGKLGEESSF